MHPIEVLQAYGAQFLSGAGITVALTGLSAILAAIFAPLLALVRVGGSRWATREQLRIAIVTWIERTYHRRRRQARLGRLTPIEYETIINPAASAA